MQPANLGNGSNPGHRARQPRRVRARRLFTLCSHARRIRLRPGRRPPLRGFHGVGRAGDGCPNGLYEEAKLVLLGKDLPFCSEERVLVHGGAGGVGSIAIQFLKSWGVEKIVATCSADRFDLGRLPIISYSFELVKSLGAHPIDYRAQNVTDQIIAEGPFEVILSCVDSDLSRWSDKVISLELNIFSSLDTRNLA